MGNENASHAAPCEGLQCEDLIFFLLMGLADHHRIAGIVQYGFRRTDDNAEEIPVDPGDDDAYNGSLAAPEVRSEDVPLSCTAFLVDSFTYGFPARALDTVEGVIPNASAISIMVTLLIRIHISNCNFKQNY